MRLLCVFLFSTPLCVSRFFFFLLGDICCALAAPRLDTIGAPSAFYLGNHEYNERNARSTRLARTTQNVILSPPPPPEFPCCPRRLQVRSAAVKGVIDIANKDPTVLSKELLQAIGQRIKDRKVRLDKSASGRTPRSSNMLVASQQHET